MSDPDALPWRPVREPWPSDAPDPVPGARLDLATPQLLVLAGAVRGTAWREELAAAIGTARTAGWARDRIGRRAAALIYDARAEPRDLAEAARSPLRRAPGTVPPEEYHRLLEDRAALEQSRAEVPARTSTTGEDPR